MLQIEGKKGVEAQFASPFSAPRHCLEKLGLPSQAHQPMNGKSWGEGQRSSRRRPRPTTLFRKARKSCTSTACGVRGELLIPPRHYQSHTTYIYITVIYSVCRTSSSLPQALTYQQHRLPSFSPTQPWPTAAMTSSCQQA